MFVLIAGACDSGDLRVLARMADMLRGGGGEPRLRTDPEQRALAAALPPDFTPEDRFDAQPIATTSGLFVCQARLDNRDELLERLELPFDSLLADAAILAAAYDRWGEGCLDRLLGDYAFAAWHRDDGRVVAAVDPLGGRRLFWTPVGSGLALSPQMPALLAHPAVSRQPDLRALAQVLDHGVDRMRTPFTSLRALPGGHVLSWRRGEPEVRRWWSPPHLPDLWYPDPRDYVEETRELFTAAVQRLLRSSGPVSSTLSGGLDSGAVTATAARALAADGQRLTSYTAIPEPGLIPSQRPNWDPDDRDYAAQVAATSPNIDHLLIPPGGRSTLDAAESVTSLSCLPAKSATNLLWFDAIAGAARRSGSRVLLTGQRGNGGFSWGGQNTVGELACLGKWSAALRQVRLEAAARGTSLARVLAGSLRASAGGLSGRSFGRTLLNPEIAVIRPSYRPAPDERGNEYSLAPGTRVYWVAFATTPAPAFWVDPVLQWGVEFRDPTADRPLTERLLRYPQAAFRIDGRHRGLARAVAEGLLPEPVRLRKTSGAQVPEAPALIAAYMPRYQAVLRQMGRSAQCRELLDLAAVQERLDRFGRGSNDYGAALRLDRVFSVGLFLLNLDKPADG